MPAWISRNHVRIAVILLAALAAQSMVLWFAAGIVSQRAYRDSTETIATLVTTAGARAVRSAVTDLMRRADSSTGRIERAIERLPVVDQTSDAIASILRAELVRMHGAAAIHFASKSTAYIVSAGSADRLSAGALNPPIDFDRLLLEMANAPTQKARIAGYFTDTPQRIRPYGDAWLYVATPLDLPGHTQGEAIIIAFHATTAIGDAIDCLLPGCHLEFRPHASGTYYDSLRRTWLPVTVNATSPSSEHVTEVSGPLSGSLEAVIYMKPGAPRPMLFAIAATATAIILALAALLAIHRIRRAARPAASGSPAPGDSNESETRSTSGATSPAGMFKRLIDANATPILVVDSGLSTIAYANPAAISTLAPNSDEPVAKPFNRFFRLAPDIVNDLLANGGQADRVQLCGPESGQFADLRFGPAQIDGKKWTMVVVADARAAMEAERTAIQAREQLDQALKRRLDSIGKQRDNYRRMVDTLKGFTSTLAHEIKNPIAVIMAAAQNLATSSDPDAVRRAARIEARAKDMTSVINRVLTAARIEANALAPVLGEADALSLLRAHAEAACEHDHSHNYEIEIADLQSACLLDRDLFALAVNNLLANAAKYSPAGSTISVCGSLEAGGVQIRIVDRGIGIPDAEKHQVFNRYYRASTARDAGIPGNGLGMALCKEIVEMLDGTIAIEDSHGGGTTVRIILPTVAGTALAAA